MAGVLEMKTELKQDLKDVKKKVDVLTEKVDHLQDGLDEISTQVDDLKTGQDAIEKKVDDVKTANHREPQKELQMLRTEMRCEINNAWWCGMTTCLVIVGSVFVFLVILVAVVVAIL
jgi:chromosome segregation ATPase